MPPSVCSIFDYASVVPASGAPGVHAPAVELLSRSKLSCLSWNKYIQAHIASSDYEGGCLRERALERGVGCSRRDACEVYACPPEVPASHLTLHTFCHSAWPHAVFCSSQLQPLPPHPCAGVVAVWDVTSGALLHEYEAHSKRIWSVDFCEVCAVGLGMNGPLVLTR